MATNMINTTYSAYKDKPTQRDQESADADLPAPSCSRCLCPAPATLIPITNPLERLNKEVKRRADYRDGATLHLLLLRQ
jgi:hypothetical protein